MKAAYVMTLAGLIVAYPAGASHDWVGLDLCRTYPERMPPELDPQLFPDPDSDGARLVGRYCSQCHFAPGPGHHTATQWAEVVPRMALLMGVIARFSDRLRPIELPNADQQAALLAYLERHALQPLRNPDVAPPAYRALCGDCHAAPDPAAYVGADWPALLARMDGHREAMRRAPMGSLEQAEITTYLVMSAELARNPAPDSAPAAPAKWATSLTSDHGRWLALGPLLVLTLLGLGRWWLGQRRRT